MEKYTKERTTDKYVFFYQQQSPFSNWHLSAFKDENGTWYDCVEQYMMAEKARLFKDERILKDIFMAGTPREYKALGRRISGFDKKTWDDNKLEIVYRGCKLKFMQNHLLFRYLMDTGDRILCEASTTDTIWGCGLSKDDDNILDERNWRGENLLGRVLTKLRDDIKLFIYG